MKLFKVPAGLFLLVQTLHLAALQDSTDSPGRTIDKSWLRKPLKAEVENNLSAETGEFNTDDISGTPSGFMLGNTDEENLLNGDLSGNQTSDDLSAFPSAMSPISENTTTTEQFGSIEDKTNTTTGSTDLSQTNVTEVEEEFNSTTTTENSTGGGDLFNKTETQPTTLAPEGRSTGETTTPEAKGELANSTETANTTANMTTFHENQQKLRIPDPFS
ncbi:unnamed protein product [Menidia menidia]|uniref:(Atlantic silverside) hypothetical protein n=1 Tax=Menidia menidia TaxID=238744 RepID=A0A8S4AC58_9TELE|nr:unnamed protein product [Menidia menidia]